MAEARIESLDRAQAEQLRLRARIDAAPAAYQDRYIDAATDGFAADADAPEAPTGFRSALIESRLGFGTSETTGRARRSAAEFGTRAEYRRETLNHGEFVLQADARHMSGDDAGSLYGIGSLGYARRSSSGRYTLRNLAFPIDAGTFADTALGDLYSETTDGLARNYRLSLGTSTLRGAATRIFSREFDLRAGFGERGNLAGGPYPGFEKSQGSLGWLGGTRRLSRDWVVAAQVDRASHIPAYDYGLFTPNAFGTKDVTSWAGAVGYGPDFLREGDVKVRTTLVGSRTRSPTPDVPTGDAHGVFVEASARSGRFRHEMGAFVADPSLYFGDYALATGSRGVYWRVDHTGARMNWGAGLDHEQGEPDALRGPIGYRRDAASANAQYLVDRHTSFGGNANLNQTRYDGGARTDGEGWRGARGFYGSAFLQTRFFDLPRSRLSLTVRRNELIVLGGGTATGQELQWEQDWIDGRYATARTEFTTTLGYARDRSDGGSRDYPTAGVQFRYMVDAGFSVSGNLRYSSQSGGLSTSRGLSGIVGAEKELAGGWRIGLAANLNQARLATRQVSFYGPQVVRSNDKTAYVYLRWEGTTGTPFQPAGVRGEAAGSGRIAGQVFLDANRDGEPQPGEAGAAGVEVLLDGRYRTTTDREGRFEFPMVATGRHQLTLTLETVPLPWGSPQDAGMSVDVPLRGQATAAMPVVRVGE